ncbi:hypothetical protein TRFO_31910 [Tritrichomonas foetus]|uniref:Uncharacterized protein n=1 Tax=Tritrichomonas foetus TaxID=1144522 RepID=A0A1J4JVJ1_9EUKA|nr:hypothetical protein TRFO_31910 [Tritrichomonas foetus]|eukprot:OHT01285.1 hypothetical protein TRFO_31910 [Tritrichomonas foetus]
MDLHSDDNIFQSNEKSEAELFEGTSDQKTQTLDLQNTRIHMIDQNTSNIINSILDTIQKSEGSNQIRISAKISSELTPDEVCQIYLTQISDSQKVNSKDFLYNFCEDTLKISPIQISITFSHMVKTENDLFILFSHEPGCLDVFLDHFVPTLNQYDFHDNQLTEMRIALIDSITYILVLFNDEIGRLVHVLKKFYSSLLLIMNNADYLSQIAAFRNAAYLYKECSVFVPKKTKKLWLFRMMAYSPSTSPNHLPAVNFIIRNYPDGFLFLPLCQVIIRQAMNDISNLSIYSLKSLEIFLSLCSDEEPFEIYIFLFRLIICNYYLGDPAVDVVCSTIITFAEDEDSLRWFVFLLRKLLIFMALSNENGRYKNRQILIEKLFDKLILVSIEYLKVSLYMILNAIIRNGYCKHLKDKTNIEYQEVDCLVDSFLMSGICDLIFPQDYKKFAQYPYEADIDSALIEDEYQSDDSITSE